ncbi:MAG TPA: dienelactone hydrolase family protein [Nitrososphaerales archaeon]|nr:dienelactone hydrolase family protein [Nitrososphaerales archaeon]
MTKHTVSAESDGRTVQIYLSRPTVPDKRPVIIVVHEWWGLNDNIRSIADRYASLGYVALAPDLFGGVIPNDRVEAAKQAENVSPDISAKILKSVLDYATMRDFTNPSKIGMHGFCFGGTHAFNFICGSKKIAAATIFYASVLPKPEKLSNITAPLLIVYGDKDNAVKVDRVRELENTLKKLKKNVQFEIYAGAGHAFCNESNSNYNKEAATDAWEKTIKFFGTYIPVPKI